MLFSAYVGGYYSTATRPRRLQALQAIAYNAVICSNSHYVWSPSFRPSGWHEKANSLCFWYQCRIINKTDIWIINFKLNNLHLCCLILGTFVTDFLFILISKEKWIKLCFCVFNIYLSLFVWKQHTISHTVIGSSKKKFKQDNQVKILTLTVALANLTYVIYTKHKSKYKSKY